MKRQFVYLLFAAMFFVACSGNQNKENDHQEGVHVHEDGTTHQDHDHDHTDSTKQEEFDVPQDSIIEQEENQHHSLNENEHSHQH